MLRFVVKKTQITKAKQIIDDQQKYALQLL